MTPSNSPIAASAAIALDVPLLPETGYIDFLNRHVPRIAACHFSLYAPDVADGRYRSRRMPLTELIKQLAVCRIPQKYLLFNARFNAADRYMSRAYMQSLTERLEALLAQDAVTGIVVADFYLLNALSDHAPTVVSALEAIPSINLMIDSADKAFAVLEGIAATHFKPPGKLTLDRALNRDSRKLADVAGILRKHHPGIRIELLANEGCLYQCPFKLTHDSLIALLNSGVHVDTLAINRDLGCLRRLHREPWRILASPFIRPEDVTRAASAADLLKICGRTLGPEFLMTVIDAYLQGSYAGNLFDLLDACSWMAASIDLPNSKLPDDFWRQMTTCTKNCRACTLCRANWKQAARPKPLAIPQRKEGDGKEGDAL